MVTAAHACLAAYCRPQRRCLTGAGSGGCRCSRGPDTDRGGHHQQGARRPRPALRGSWGADCFADAGGAQGSPFVIRGTDEKRFLEDIPPFPDVWSCWGTGPCPDGGEVSSTPLMRWASCMRLLTTGAVSAVPWVGAFPPAGRASNAIDGGRAAVPTPRYLPRAYAPLSGSCTPVAISLAHTSGSLPLARETCQVQSGVFLPSPALGQRGRDAAPAFFGRLPPAVCLSVQRVYAVPYVCSLASVLPSWESLP